MLFFLAAPAWALVAADGTAREFGPGDAWVIPSGWRGTWETLEPARKHYVIYEAG
jgi:uncharacterized cupin superfamily protein